MSCQKVTHTHVGVCGIYCFSVLNQDFLKTHNWNCATKCAWQLSQTVFKQYYQIKVGPHRLINISFISGHSALIFSATKLQLCPSLKHISCGYLWKGKKAGWVSNEERVGGLLWGSLGRVGWAIPCLPANTTTAATHSSLHSWCIFRQKQAYLPAV